MLFTDVLSEVCSRWFDISSGWVIHMTVMKCFGPFPDQLWPSVITQSQQSLSVYISFGKIRRNVLKLMFKTRNRTSSNINIARCVYTEKNMFLFVTCYHFSFSLNIQDAQNASRILDGKGPPKMPWNIFPCRYLMTSETQAAMLNDVIL
jgi:hypothetical protein